MTPQEQEEMVRSERFGRLLDTLRNIESDMPLLMGTNENTRTAGRSGSNFYNGKGPMAKNNAREENKEQNLYNYLWSAPHNTFNSIQKIKAINK